jgi:hypothetical protein
LLLSLLLLVSLLLLALLLLLLSLLLLVSLLLLESLLLLATANYGFASVGTAVAGVRDLFVIFATAGTVSALLLPGLCCCWRPVILLLIVSLMLIVSLSLAGTVDDDPFFWLS